MIAKHIVARLLGQRNLGRLDYLLKPRLRDSWGGPFNGQIYRQQLVSEIIKNVGFNAIVETGTYRGSTTLFLAAFGLPVYTVESSARFSGFAATRFLGRRNKIHVREGDTRTWLRTFGADQRFPRSKVFFYLDAHWEADLPLGEELDIIFTQWTGAVVMVDDFQVPGTGFGYDDYGPGKVLNMEYVRKSTSVSLVPFFPAVGSEGETGLKRGCVVLCSEPDIVRSLHTTATLKAGQ